MPSYILQTLLILYLIDSHTSFSYINSIIPSFIFWVIIFFRSSSQLMFFISESVRKARMERTHISTYHEKSLRAYNYPIFGVGPNTCSVMSSKCYSLPTWNFKILCLHSLYMQKAMATHSSSLAWKVPWTEEPGRLQSMGSLRVRHYWVTSLSLFAFTHWRRKWQLTPVFLPGES